MNFLLELQTDGSPWLTLRIPMLMLQSFRGLQSRKSPAYTLIHPYTFINFPENPFQACRLFGTLEYTL